MTLSFIEHLNRIRNLYSLTRAGTSLARLATSRTAIVHLAFHLCVRTNILESSRIFVVCIDTGKLAAVLSSDTLNVDVSFALRLALNRKLAVVT